MDSQLTGVPDTGDSQSLVSRTPEILKSLVSWIPVILNSLVSQRKCHSLLSGIPAISTPWCPWFWIFSTSPYSRYQKISAPRCPVHQGVILKSLKLLNIKMALGTIKWTSRGCLMKKPTSKISCYSPFKNIWWNQTGKSRNYSLVQKLGVKIYSKYSKLGEKYFKKPTVAQLILTFLTFINCIVSLEK